MEIELQLRLTKILSRACTLIKIIPKQNWPLYRQIVSNVHKALFLIKYLKNGFLRTFEKGLPLSINVKKISYMRQS